jgi:DNA-directed RNA polymerase specialized sigma subunit
MQIKEYEYLINKILSKVPSYIRDDCYQAACMGLLKAKEREHSVEFFKSYAYRCMQNEVTKEVAKLHGSGNGLFTLDKTTFLLFCEYKRRKSRDASIEDMNLSQNRIDTFETMITSNRYTYEENPFAKDEWCE